MSSEIDVLLHIQDKPDWDLFDRIFHPSSAMLARVCKYRYDKKEQAVYREEIEHRAYYTYIAKAEGHDVYKVGRTTNLKRRIKQLGSEYPYSFLDLKPFAYCDRDIENSIKGWSSCHFRKLPDPFRSAEELLLLKEKDIKKLMSKCGFKRITEKIPGYLTIIRREYYHPESGKYIKTIVSSYEP